MISLVGLSASPACRLIGLVGLIGLSNQWLHNCLNAAINVAAVTISTVLATQGVATTQSSPTKIAYAASFYDLSTELLHVHLLMRENMMWWWLALEKKSDDGGLPLLANPTTVMCNNMQNNYFLSGFRK